MDKEEAQQQVAEALPDDKRISNAIEAVQNVMDQGKEGGQVEAKSDPVSEETATKDTTEGVQPAEGQETQEDTKFTSRLASLARKEARVRRQEQQAIQQIEAKKQELAQYEEQVRRFQEAKTWVATDPVGFLTHLGLEDQESRRAVAEMLFIDALGDNAPPELTNRNTGRSFAAQQMRMQKEMEQWKREQEQRMQQAQQQQTNQAALNEYVDSLYDEMIDVDETSFPMLSEQTKENEEEALTFIYNIADSIARTQGMIPTAKQAVQAAEKQLETLYKRLSKKQAQENVEESTPKVAEVKTQTLKNNSSSQKSDYNKDNDQILTDEERIRRAVASMERIQAGQAG